MKFVSRPITRLLLLGGASLSCACSRSKESTHIPEEFVNKLIQYEKGMFTTQDDWDGMGFSGSDDFESRSGARNYWPKRLKDFDSDNPVQSLKMIMNELIAFAADNKMGVRRNSWDITTFGPSDVIGDYNDSVSFHYQGAGSYGVSGALTEAKDCRDRYIQAKISFGHVENISFIYNWGITYDVIDQQCRVTSYLSFAQPVAAPHHAPDLVNLEIK